MEQVDINIKKADNGYVITANEGTSKERVVICRGWELTFELPEIVRKELDADKESNNG
jgi:hypothetical protein